MSAMAATRRGLSYYSRLSLLHMMKPLRHIFPKRKLSPHETTKLYYLLSNECLYKICGFAGWADCAANDASPYEKKYRDILDLVGCDDTTRVLEIGPGTGALLNMASQRAREVVGIDLCPESVQSCRDRGLNVIEGDAIPVLESLPESSFDIVIANSTMEHAVSEEAALQGQADATWQRLFRAIRGRLTPNGRAYVSMIHTRTPEEPADAIRDPFEFPILSKKFHLALMTQVFSGWYPQPGQLERNAALAGLKKVREIDATADYLAACEQRQILPAIYNPLMAYRVIANRKIRGVLAEYPHQSFLNLSLLLAQSFQWQFVPSDNGTGVTPMVYFCQVYQRSAEGSLT